MLSLADDDRGATADLNIEQRKLTESLFPSAPKYNFFTLVDLLHRIHGDDQERDQDYKSQTQRVRFSACAAVSFARSDIQTLGFLADKITRDHAVNSGKTVTEQHQVDVDSRYFLETTFLGLHGAQSPLPYHYIDTTSHEYAQNYPGLRNFLDFFNQRLITLIYRSWRKYRYYLRFQPDATDAISQQMFSLIGLADQNLRGKTQINWCKMLSYVGTLAGRSRSPQIVSGIVAHYFELSHVNIEQWVFRRVDIPDFQLAKAGEQNCSLGNDFVIGSKAPDRRGKFVLSIKSLTHERFRDFLPNGKDFPTLVKLIEFTFREPLAYDLDLGLLPSALSSMKIGDESSGRLGWSSFIGNQQRLQRTPRSVLIHVRS